MADVGDGTGAGLQLFLEWTLRKGELPEATVKNLQTACSRVLSLEEDPSSVDLHGLDVDTFLDRFETKNRANYKTSSMAVYRSRFRQAVTIYRAWLNKDADWKSASREARATTRQTSPTKKRLVRKPSATAVPDSRDASITPEAPAAPSGMVTYDVPLRPGLRARLVLPEDLTTREAARLSAFVKVLAVEGDDVQQAAAQDPLGD